ncbi:MAG: DUF1269 domain-containing protein [Nitrospirales bacterium]
MADNQNVFVFIASYSSVDYAMMDYSAVQQLYIDGAIDTYDAAVVQKDIDGNVHVSKHEKPTQKGAWTGIGVGAVVGVLFPPAIIPMAAAGGLAGGVIGHVWHGMSRSDMKDLGETLDAGTAALVVVGKSSLADKIAKATAKAQKTTEKQLNVDAKDFDKELEAESKAMQ